MRRRRRLLLAALSAATAYLLAALLSATLLDTLLDAVGWGSFTPEVSLEEFVTYLCVVGTPHAIGFGAFLVTFVSVKRRKR